MEALEARLGYTFRDRALLENALMHSSYANENRARGYTSNERLEFLGDSVLGMVTAARLYALYPDMPEGKMSRLRAELVCEQALHGVALTLHLGDYIRLGHGEERSGGRERPSILADAVEAVIAAMYLDGGLEPAQRFILAHILNGLAEGEIHHVEDYKTELQERVQRRAGQTLSYTVCAESGPDHNKTFTMAVLLNGSEIGRGTGRTKRRRSSPPPGARSNRCRNNGMQPPAKTQAAAFFTSEKMRSGRCKMAFLAVYSTLYYFDLRYQRRLCTRRRRICEGFCVLKSIGDPGLQVLPGQDAPEF